MKGGKDMAVVADTQQAVQILHGIQGRLEDSGDVALSQQVAVMVKLLDSPSFKQLLNLQQAIKQLKEHINTSPPGSETDFDFSPDGELVLPHEEPIQESRPPESPGPSHPYAFENVTFEHDEDTITPSVAAVAASAPKAASPVMERATPGRISLNDERLGELAFNRELVAVDLVKPVDGGLGFTVVGLNSKSHGDLGIFIQKIQPDTVAARDGRLQDSDQILAINDQILHSGISHKDAIAMLHKIKGEVHLVIARGDFDLSPTSEVKTASEQVQESEPTRDESAEESADDIDSVADIMTIDLTNDGGGLGFGIVGVHNTGIVVKTIVPGGVADRDGRLESGDIILKIGDTTLEGMNSTTVAGVLRRSGNHVQLTVIKKGIRVPRPPTRAAPPREPVVAKVEEPKVELAPPPPTTSPPPDVAVDTPKVELEFFEIDLQKTTQGLGLSIAGFEENRPDGVEAGIFVKAIAPGSAAALSNKVSVGDQIIEVDGQPVHGYGNRQAVELLRSTGSVVHLKLARRKKAPTVNGTPEYAKLETPAVPTDDDKPKQEDKIEEETNEVSVTSEEEVDVRVEVAAAVAVMAAAPPREPEELPPVEPLRVEQPRTEPTVVEPVPPEEPTVRLTYPSSPSGDAASKNDPSVQVALWQSMLGPMVTILVSEVEKEGSLGIVLEGRMDIDEHGQEIQPRHYISTVVDDGPIGRQSLLTKGDELLEVNGIRLYGRNHHEVVDILRNLPSQVRLICGRHDNPPVVIDGDIPIRASQEEVIQQARSLEEESQPPEVPRMDEPEAETVSVHSDTPSGVSHESLMGVSVWSDQVQTVTLVKGDQGLGFSILDYQDPLKPDSNVILIRSLVEGGIAESDGRLIPGDRLMSVNEVNLENATLETAVEAVRSAPRGQVRIGVAKPLPSAIIEEQREALAQQTKEEEEKRQSLERDAPIVAVSATLAHAAAPPAKTNPPDLIANDPPKPAPRKSLSSSPPPEPSHPAPAVPVAMSSTSASLKFRPDYVELPESLEKKLVLKKAQAGMGMTVTADQANGAIIKSIIRGGCVHEDGTLAVGDYITAVNGDSTRNMSNTNIRGLLRKCFFGGSEISLMYITASDAAAYRKQIADARGSSESDDDDIWEDIRVVEVYRETGKSLGISILGGRVGQGLLEGIFIKHVLEDSPAGKTGELKTGDRILEVNDCDLRDATHDQAVAIIKNAPNPVKFKVQSLTPELQPAYLSEIDDQPYQATMIMSMDGDKSDSEVDGDAAETGTISSVDSEDEPEDEYGYTNRMIRERYADLPGEYLILEITKVGKSLGLSLTGNKDAKVLSVFVVGVHAESPAAIEGSIMIGDELMEINGIKVYGHSHREASMIIGDLPEGPVKLVVRRRQEAVHELSVPYLKETPDSQIPLALKKPVAAVVLDLTDGGDLNEESGDIDLSSFPNVHTITLHKGTTGLGFFIYEKADHAGRPGIFVKEISHGGAAGKEGSLQIDDQILAVDDLPLIGLTKMSAISVLKGTRGKVELTVSSAKVQSSNPYLTTSRDEVDGRLGEAVIAKSAVENVQSKPPDDKSDLDSGPLTAPILQKTQTSIILDRGSKNLGLKIAGGSDTDIPIIIIDEVYEGGAAFKDGRLRPGDQLLAVNGVQLSNVTHAEALQILKEVPALVPMIVFRVESDATSTETWEEQEVELLKKDGQGLGLSIIGKKNDQGVFISDIVKGGTAHRDGRLRRGDRLLAVDGKDVVKASKDVVAPMLRNAVGYVRLKVGRLTAETVAPLKQSPAPEETSTANPPKEESLLSELMNDPQLDPAAGDSGTGESGDSQEEEDDVVDPGAPIQTVVLDRGPDGLGFSIVGGSGSPHGDLPIYIKTVFDRGAAVDSGVLKRGDQIVEVNGMNLQGASHKEAVSILKQVRGKVELKIIAR